MLRIKQAKLNHNRVLRFQLVSIAISLLFTLSIANAKAAAHEISRVRLSVKPLDLTRPPTADELMAAGQLGGLLYPTADIEIEDTRSFLEKFFQIGMKSSDIARLEKNKHINLSFGRAIEAWNKHEYKNAVQLFRKHIEIYPESPWVSEAVLHIGCDARYNGRYSEAEEKFRWLIKTNQGSDHVGRKMLLNKARQRLAVLKVLQNNFEEAGEHFRILKAESPDWRHRTYASHWLQRLSKYKAHKIAMLNCGVLALAELLQRDGKPKEAAEVRQMRPDSFKGHSIEDLVSIATQYGYQLSGRRVPIDNLDKVPLPAIVQIDGRNSGDSGHYWILEQYETGRLRLFDPQSGRRFHQQPDEFAREWEGIVLVFSDSESLPGVKLADHDLGNIYGGCCGAPRPENNQGDPGDEAGPGGDGDGCGSPRWSVNMLNMNLFVTDTPIWHISAIGPPVEITVSYNSQSAIAYREPFGNKWQFNYASYMVIDTSGTVTVFMPDGRRDVYTADGAGGYDSPYQVFNTLTKLTSTRYELRLPDDTVYLYDEPSSSTAAVSSSAAIIPPSTIYQSYLTEIRDVYGQSLGMGYDVDGKLISITDATGKVTTLTYNGDGLVTQVSDPFGRNAQFEYDANRNLVKITDMAGYWSTFSYDDDIYLTSMANQRGNWQFYIEPADQFMINSDNYPPPGDPMWANYRITVTNPLGEIQEYFYYGGCDQYGCTGSSWYVSARDYVRWQSHYINNFRGDAPKTRYLFTSPFSQTEEISKVIFPEGGYYEYGYDDSGNLTSITDSHGYTSSYEYNAKGKITSFTDPKGTTTQLIYAGNNIDLIEVNNSLGSLRWLYNQTHDITSFTDRLNNTHNFTYNGFGQITSWIDAAGNPTIYAYDSSHQLRQISTDGQVLGVLAYDTFGRVQTYTDQTGLTLSFEYNELDALTRVTFPDSKDISIDYTGCCPDLIEGITDRAGKSLQWRYDAVKRPIEFINTDGTKIKGSYDSNGNLVELKDPNGNSTRFEYNLDNFLIRKTYSDDTYLTFAYDEMGRLVERVNARGVRSDFVYDENNNLVGITYADATPSVTYVYDAYNRVVERQDGIGTYQFSYDANSQLKEVNGPWENDTVTYSYDELGNRTGLSVQGADVVTYVYDNLNRLTSIQQGTKTYSYTYAGASPLVQEVLRPNGATTQIAYDLLNRLTSVTNRSSTSDIINQYTYTFDQNDYRASESVINGGLAAPAQTALNTYRYNLVNQIIDTTNPLFSFEFDNDGNMVRGITPGGYVFTAAYDAENRLTAVEYTDGSGMQFSSLFAYNGADLLSRKVTYQDGSGTSDIRFIRDLHAVLQERDDSNTTLSEYLWGLSVGGGIGGLHEVSQGGGDYYYLYDGKGNVVAVIDHAQQIVAGYTYDLFGLLAAQTGTLQQPYLFSTKRYDKGTGLLYYGYRFYAPLLGRWISRDPIGEFGWIYRKYPELRIFPGHAVDKLAAAWGPALSDESDHNLYAFVGNNPVNFVDPFGKQTAAASFPSTAITPPSSGSPVPIPYPNMGQSPGCRGAGRKMGPIRTQSDFSKSMGDESGTLKGHMSARNMDRAKYSNMAMDVWVKGKNLFTGPNMSIPP